MCRSSLDGWRAAFRDMKAPTSSSFNILSAHLGRPLGGRKRKQKTGETRHRSRTGSGTHVGREKCAATKPDIGPRAGSGHTWGAKMRRRETRHRSQGRFRNTRGARKMRRRETRHRSQGRFRNTRGARKMRRHETRYGSQGRFRNNSGIDLGTRHKSLILAIPTTLAIRIVSLSLPLLCPALPLPYCASAAFLNRFDPALLRLCGFLPRFDLPYCASAAFLPRFASAPISPLRLSCPALPTTLSRL